MNKNKHSIFFRSILFVLAGFVITSCGGGGGSTTVPAVSPLTTGLTYTISGKVTTAAGAGLSGITVKAAGTSTATATTNTEGNYSFTAVSTGSYTLTPSSPGYTFSPATKSVTMSDTNVQEITFEGSSKVVTLTEVTSIASEGTYSVSLMSNGAVYAWGDNGSGQLGDGTTIRHFTPIQAPGLTGVTTIAIAGHTLALMNDGTVWAWGLNRYGQLGDGTTTDRTTPAAIPGVSGVTAIDASFGSTFILKNDGTVWAFGYNSVGQLGDGTTTDRNTPVKLDAISGVTAISASGSAYFESTAALKNDGTIWMWGDNTFGQLGDGTTNSRSTPAQVAGLSNVIAITTKGGHHTVALKSDGTVWAWGSAYAGDLGIGIGSPNQLTPVQVPGMTGVIAIAAGDGVAGGHTVALKKDGTVWTWGDNYAGQLGDGTTQTRYSPAKVAGLSDVAAIAAAWGCTFAVKKDGTLWAWGDNLYGQLGDGTTTRQSFPVQVTGH